MDELKERQRIPLRDLRLMAYAERIPDEVLHYRRTRTSVARELASDLHHFCDHARSICHVA